MNYEDEKIQIKVYSFIDIFISYSIHLVHINIELEQIFCHESHCNFRIHEKKKTPLSISTCDVCAYYFSFLQNQLL